MSLTVESRENGDIHRPGAEVERPGYHNVGDTRRRVGQGDDTADIAMG